MKRPSLGVLAAAAFVLLSVGSGLLRVLTDWADEWTVNIATELGALALTLAIVERIIRRESEARARPLVTRALDGMAWSLEWIGAWIGTDYAETHLDDARAVPMKVLALLDLWIAEEGTVDAKRTLGDGGVPAVVSAAHSHLHDLEQIRRDYRDHLDPSLVLALDSFIRSMEFSWVAATTSADDPGGQHASVNWLVRAARDFAEEYEKHADPVTLDDEYRGLIEGTRYQALARRSRG